MSGNNTKDRTNNIWLRVSLGLLFSFLLLAFPGNTQENNDSNRSNQLPQSPDTGSPEQDFSAGGTRGEDTPNRVCNLEKEKFVYLLANQDRESTLSPHPIFWFHLPPSLGQNISLEFAIKDLEADRTIYTQIIQENKKSGVMGIALPPQKSNGLTLEKDYGWTLEISCANTEGEAEIVLAGELNRLAANPQIEKELATTAKAEKYQIYWQHDLLNDAVTELATLQMNAPQNTQIRDEWYQLLIDLGWEDLMEVRSAMKPGIFGNKVSASKDLKN